MFRRAFKAGDFVVFCKMKHKTHPGRRARKVYPAANGDDYSYLVEKFWVVEEALPSGRLLLQTPRGKKHLVDADDPKLRHATLLDRLRHRARFAQFHQHPEPAS